MKIIINTTTMIPIFKQIIDQIKEKIMKGELKEGTQLPSVRSLSKDLKISALTVKKAYDQLDEEGFIVTVHGKGSFVSKVNDDIKDEERKKEIEEELQEVIVKGRRYGLSDEELSMLFQILLEE